MATTKNKQAAQPQSNFAPDLKKAHADIDKNLSTLAYSIIGKKSLSEATSLVDSFFTDKIEVEYTYANTPYKAKVGFGLGNRKVTKSQETYAASAYKPQISTPDEYKLSITTGVTHNPKNYRVADPIRKYTIHITPPADEQTGYTKAEADKIISATFEKLPTQRPIHIKAKTPAPTKTNKIEEINVPDFTILGEDGKIIEELPQAVQKRTPNEYVKFVRAVNRSNKILALPPGKSETKVADKKTEKITIPVLPKLEDDSYQTTLLSNLNGFARDLYNQAVEKKEEVKETAVDRIVGDPPITEEVITPKATLNQPPKKEEAQMATLPRPRTPIKKSKKKWLKPLIIVASTVAAVALTVGLILGSRTWEKRADLDDAYIAPPPGQEQDVDNGITGKDDSHENIYGDKKDKTDEATEDQTEGNKEETEGNEEQEKEEKEQEETPDDNVISHPRGVKSSSAPLSNSHVVKMSGYATELFNEPIQLQDGNTIVFENTENSQTVFDELGQ